MKRVAPPLLCLLLVLAAAVLRPRFSTEASPLPPSPGGVVLIAVEGMGIREAAAISAWTPFLAYGLIPTNYGTPDESDFDAGLRMILAGTRHPGPDPPSLDAVAKRERAPFRLHTCTGSGAVREAARLVAEYTAPGGSADATSVIVVGVTPPTYALERRERVAPVLWWVSGLGESLPPRLLTSPSTRRRPGLIAATDLAATIAVPLGIQPETGRFGEGRPIETLPPGAVPEPLLDPLAKSVSVWGLQAREQKLLSFVPWFLAGLFLLRFAAPSEAVRRASSVAALSIPLALILGAAVPVGIDASLVPAWAVYGIAAVPVLTLTAIAGRNAAWGDQMPRLLALATVLVIAGDTCAGSPLLSRSALSYSVLEAARFYGIGNEISGVFIGAAIVAVGANGGTFATLLYGAAVAVVLGAPALGADAGGFLSALVAFTTLALVSRRGPAREKKPMVPHALIAGLAVLVAVVAFAWWEGSRPASSRTHIGEAVAGATRGGGLSNIGSIAGRKLRVNARLLTVSPWAVLLYAQVAVLAWGFYKNARQESTAPAPAARGVALGLFGAMLSLFAANDSGVVAGATCGCWLCGAGDARTAFTAVRAGVGSPPKSADPP